MAEKSNNYSVEEITAHIAETMPHAWNEYFGRAEVTSLTTEDFVLRLGRDRYIVKVERA